MTTSGFARLPFRLIVTLGLATAVVAGCDSAEGAGGEDHRRVTVIGSGQVQGVPDTLTADVGVEVSAPDVTAAMNQTSGRQQAVVDALVDAGVDRKNISTTDVSLQPEYGNGDVITGYRAGNTLRFKVGQDTASRALAAVVSSGGDAARINSVSYSIDEDAQLMRDARERAFHDAEDRAKQYAELSGLRLGKVISIAEQASGGPPTPTPMPRSAMIAPIPLEPGQQNVSFSVSVSWELG